MNLLIDSGNSFIKWAAATDDSFMVEGRCGNDAVSCLAEKWANYDAPDRVLVSNVAGQHVASEIRKIVTLLWQKDAEFVVSGRSCCGVTNSYSKPEQLGVDRWMAMLAAYNMRLKSVIIVDCGTAVTIDLVNENGLFLGGAILPGLNLAFRSLWAGTDALAEISSISCNASPVSLSTEDAIASGVLLGMAGSIERLVKEQSLLVDEQPAVLICGGDAEKIISHLAIPASVQADMVLHGLRLFANSR